MNNKLMLLFKNFIIILLNIINIALFIFYIILSFAIILLEGEATKSVELIFLFFLILTIILNFYFIILSFKNIVKKYDINNSFFIILIYIVTLNFFSFIILEKNFLIILIICYILYTIFKEIKGVI